MAPSAKGLPPGFLPEVSGVDTDFRPPPRKSCRVTPLIDGTKTAIEIERTIMDAESSIYMAYWDLSLGLEPQSDEARALGYTSMQPLLFDAVRRGVDVRIFLTDADPLADVDVHRDSWSVYRELTEQADVEATKDPTFDREKFQVVCSLPLAELTAASLRGMISDPALTVLLFNLIESNRLSERIDELNAEASSDRMAAIGTFADMPGLWEDIDLTTSTTRAFKAAGSLPRPFGAATHHLKLTVVDGKKAILGGSNLNARIVDNLRHDLAGLTHDINCMVEGDIAGDLVLAFQGWWNLFLGVAAAFIATKNPHAVHSSFQIPISPATPLIAPTPAKSRPDVSVVQLVRTSTAGVSTPAAGSHRAPEPILIRGDFEEAYEAALKGAKKYIYIENQYFRWPPLADWIKAALSASPSLNVIVLLPSRPEEGDDPFTHHGLLVRRKTIETLHAVAPGRVGFFTLQSKTPSALSSPYVGKEVYVHSKLLIVDDELAVIGSANLNGRSFRVDTEIGVVWHHRRAIKKFRLMLWSHLLGRHAREINKWHPATYASSWNTIAMLHVGTPASTRDGFVVPLMEPSASLMPPNPLVDELDVLLPTPSAEKAVKDLEPLFEIHSNISDEKPSPAPAAPPNPKVRNV